MSYFTSISYSDTGSLDAFSRLRVSSPDALFATQCQYNADPIQMESGASGTGTTADWNSSTRMVALVSTGTGTSFIQSYQYSPYGPGKSQFIAITGVVGSGVVGATVDTYYGDLANGVIFRQNGTTNLQLILRTSTGGSVSDANIANQADWNLDTLLGTGPSGLTLDITKAMILIIDLQFLGMGRVRVGFDINGIVYYVHQFLNANNLTVPYMQTANLPIGMLVTTTAGAKTAYFKCASVISEGGSISDYGIRNCTPEGTVTAGSGARTHILSVKPLTTYNGITNRILFLAEMLNFCVTGANPVRWELMTGCAFSVAPTYANVNTTYSGFSYGTGGTLSAAGLTLLSGFIDGATGAVGKSVSVPLDINMSLHHPITLDRAGAVRANGTLSLIVSGIGGTSATRACMDFTEIR